MKKCSFCGNPVSEYEKGIKAVICKSCISILNENLNAKSYTKQIKNIKLTPPLLKSELDDYVIGQELAKKKISLEVCNHLKRITLSGDMLLPKNNILMVGSTGSGKTYIVETLSNILDVPLVIGDATGLTETGYRGKDVESLLLSLIEKAGGDIQKAEKGIIYIDEIDKIGQSDSDAEKEVGKLSVQNALLKILEGTEYVFDKTGETINTKNILFICGGAFNGLDKIIEKRLSKKATIGFNSNSTKSEDASMSKDVITEDLFKFGLSKEFLGRLTNIVQLDTLTEDDLMNILLNAKNSVLKQYENLLKVDGISLEFEKDALRHISQLALKKGVGARGLNQMIFDKLSDLIFDLSLIENSTLKITKDIF